jgi:thymidylate synthase ThyX
MQAREECDNLVDECDTREEFWKDAMYEASSRAGMFSKAGYHKQIVNRLLEPFQHITVIVTATEWENFFNLRLHPDAQPEIHELARVMKESMDESLPKKISWHLPYILEEEFTNLEVIDNEFGNLIKYSVARCARVSYLTHDGSSPDTDKDLKLYDMLLESKHMSPFEHQAKPMTEPEDAGPFWWEDGVTHMDREENLWSGNFKGWIQNRQLIK